MTNYKKYIPETILVVIVVAVASLLTVIVKPEKPSELVKQTPTRPAVTRTNTPRPSATVTHVMATDTPLVIVTNEPTANPDNDIAPFREAELCSDTGENHDTNKFHTIWKKEGGCHYDHEHGTSPFTEEVYSVFPGFDLYALLGAVEIGHTNPSSPMENTHKHGGWKWDVMLANPHGCLGGFEGSPLCIKAAVIGYHAFGDYSIEMQARQHSAVYLLLICDPSNPSDCGTLFVTNLEDYGQRVSPYQTTVIYTIGQGCTVDNGCPVNPVPSYEAARGPYNTIDCVGTGLPGCRTSIAQIVNSNLNTASKWSSKPTGTGIRPARNGLADLLFDVRDTYQLLDSRDLVYPFNFAWVCSPSNNGLSYNPNGCKHNNAATKVNEINGFIPASMDNLIGFDVNMAIGRITTNNAFVDAFGNPALDCTVAGGNCYPIKMTNMFIGMYGDYLSLNKVSILTPLNLPSRNFFWCGSVLCAETAPGAIPSGWIGASN